MGGIFNNRLLFENSRLLLSLFSENFCGGDKALMEGDKVVIGDPPVPPTRENPVHLPKKVP